MNKKVIIGVLMVAIFLMSGFNIFTGIENTGANTAVTSLSSNSSLYNKNGNNLKNIENRKINSYKIGNYSILSCNNMLSRNNILNVDIDNHYYEIKWIVSMVAGNETFQLHFHKYNIIYTNNSIIVHGWDRYAGIYSVLSANNKSLNSNIVIKSNVAAVYNIKFVEGNNIKNYRTVKLPDNYSASLVNGIQTSWANEMGIFHNGILRINNSSYMLLLNFNNIKLSKGQAYSIDPAIKPMRLPVEPCTTTLTFKLYDNPLTKIDIYNIKNEIIVYGTDVCYNAYYCLVDKYEGVKLDNWHEVSCNPSTGHDYSKISACFEGVFLAICQDSVYPTITNWRSSVCTKITDNSGTFHGYIHNEIWEKVDGGWKVWSDETVVNSQISAATDNSYREYII